MKPLSIVACPTNLGLKELTPGLEPGVRRLPAWLEQHGLYEQLQVQEVHTVVAPAYAMDIDPASGVRNADAIVAYAQQQASLLQELMVAGKFPLVIGGDCSIIIGNMLALKKRGRYGLFFLDGHTDYMDVALSGTKAAAGMDLSIVTGYAHDKLANIEEAGPYVAEQDTWAVGNRWQEVAYVNEIRRSGIRYVDLPVLRRMGITQAATEFLQMITASALDGFWIHIDVDVLNNDIMPAVDSPQEDGLHYGEFEHLLGLLLQHPKVTGMDISILDPNLDPTGKYTRPFIDSLVRVLRSRDERKYQ